MTTPADAPRDLLDEVEQALKAATPGPWRAEGLPYDGCIDPVVVAGELYIAQTVYDMQSVTMQHAVNADTYLIAHAPEWLALLVQRTREAESEAEQECERADELVSALRDAEADRDEWRVAAHRFEELYQSAQRAEAETARLREALEPFADAMTEEACAMFAAHPGAIVWEVYEGGAPVTAGDVIRAKALLGASRPGEPQP